MTGTAKRIIDALIDQKAQGDKTIEKNLRVKLILGGIMVDKLTESTPDNPALINKIRNVAIGYGVNINDLAEVSL
ncbi:MAG: hypothetical protein FWE90_07365 [Defluviitaleaceae bacterium]|nr:hypothetical protein [Defluviitaleaceae bacterium]